jgi:hypothetical protein
MTLSTTAVPKDIELKIRTAVELKKELAKYEKDIKDALLEAMQQYDITKIDNPNYYVTLVPKTTYKAEEISEVDPTMIKSVLDTKRAGQYDTLYGELPDGVTKTVTHHIRWDTK